MAHTQGPWRLNAGNSIEIMGGCIPNKAIARALCGGMTGIKLDEAEANARLIAAAPELLKALEELWQTVKVAIYTGDWKVDGACDPESDLNRARAAIAKARGEA